MPEEDRAEVPYSAVFRMYGDSDGEESIVLLREAGTTRAC